MGFDANSDQPLIQPKKRTTKVNFAVVIAVLVFFAISAVALYWFSRNPERAVPTEEKRAP
jgi:hypothetical protein